VDDDSEEGSWLLGGHGGTEANPATREEKTRGGTGRRHELSALDAGWLRGSQVPTNKKRKLTPEEQGTTLRH